MGKGEGKGYEEWMGMEWESRENVEWGEKSSRMRRMRKIGNGEYKLKRSRNKEKETERKRLIIGYKSGVSARLSAGGAAIRAGTAFVARHFANTYNMRVHVYASIYTPNDIPTYLHTYTDT